MRDTFYKNVFIYLYCLPKGGIHKVCMQAWGRQPNACRLLQGGSWSCVGTQGHEHWRPFFPNRTKYLPPHLWVWFKSVFILPGTDWISWKKSKTWVHKCLPQPLGIVNSKKFWPKSSWSTKHLSFDLNLEQHSGLKVRGTKISFIR